MASRRLGSFALEEIADCDEQVRHHHRRSLEPSNFQGGEDESDVDDTKNTRGGHQAEEVEADRLSRHPSGDDQNGGQIKAHLERCSHHILGSGLEAGGEGHTGVINSVRGVESCMGSDKVKLAIMLKTAPFGLFPKSRR